MLKIIFRSDLPPNQPAMSSMVLPEIYLNKNTWGKFSRAEQIVILLHEIGHKTMNTSNEFMADAFAFAWIAKNKPSMLKAQVTSLTRVLQNTDYDKLRTTLMSYHNLNYRKIMNKDYKTLYNENVKTLYSLVTTLPEYSEDLNLSSQEKQQLQTAIDNGTITDKTQALIEKMGNYFSNTGVDIQAVVDTYANGPLKDPVNGFLDMIIPERRAEVESTYREIKTSVTSAQKNILDTVKKEQSNIKKTLSGITTDNDQDETYFSDLLGNVVDFAKENKVLVIVILVAFFIIRKK